MISRMFSTAWSEAMGISPSPSYLLFSSLPFISSIFLLRLSFFPHHILTNFLKLYEGASKTNHRECTILGGIYGNGIQKQKKKEAKKERSLTLV